MGEKIFIVAILVIIAFLVGFYLAPKPVDGLLGGSPRFSPANLVYGTSSIGTVGARLWTNASNTGEWFLVQNISAGPGVHTWCGIVTASSSLVSQQGRLLTGSTTAPGVWELWGGAGDAWCLGDANSAVSYIYTSR